VLLRSALWLAVVQALASIAPAGLPGPVDAPSRLAAVAAPGADSAAHAQTRSAETKLWALLLGDEQFRPPAPQRLRSVERTSDRGVPTLRSPFGLVAVAAADLSFSLASLAPPAQHRLSHAAASRGDHLPYYPSAPPLQG
jgi:hypothetical protein